MRYHGVDMEDYDFFTRDMMPEIHRVSTLPHCNGELKRKWTVTDISKRRTALMKKSIKNGNQLRLVRIKNDDSCRAVSKIIGCAVGYIEDKEKLTGKLSPTQKKRLRPYYGDVVDEILKKNV